MAHVLKLLRGDKRSPTRTLDIAGSTATDNIYLQQGGFAAGSGPLDAVWSGRTSRRDGEELISLSRGNAQLTITVDFSGGNTTELSEIERRFARFFEEIELKELDNIGEDVWLEYRWQDNLSSVAAPAWGQWSYYYRVKLATINNWPANVHPGVIAGEIEEIVITLTCDPYPEGLDQKLLHADGLPDSDADVNMYVDFDNAEIDQDFTIAGWITHRESDYYVFEYYVDSNDYLRIFWDESDDRFEMVRNDNGSTQTRNGSTGGGYSAGDNIHIAIIHDFTTDTEIQMYVNGVADGTTATAVDWANGSLYLGVSNSDTTPTANASGLDAWRVWSSELTATNISDLYTLENQVKSKSTNNIISQPPYLKTRTGDGNFDTVDGVLSAAAQDNWGVAGWIPGSAPAKTRYEIVPDQNTLKWWLGRRASTSTYTPAGTSWLDFSGTTDTGNSSGDAYQSETIGYDFSATITAPQHIRGRSAVLAKLSNGAAATVTPFVQLGGANAINFEDISIALDATQKLRYLKDIIVDWPQSGNPSTLKVGLDTAGTAGGTNIADDAVEYWKLEEASGTRAGENNSYDLTDNNTVTQAAGIIGNCALFTPANSEYLSSTNANLIFEGHVDMSIVCWVYFPTSLPSGFPALINGDDTAEWCYALYYDGTANRLLFSVQNSGGTNTTVTASTFGALSADTWYFVYCHHDPTADTIGISVNDGTIDTIAFTDGLYAQGGSAFFGIGHPGTSTGLAYFDGRIDSVAVYNSILTAQNITDLYNSGAGLEPIASSSTVNLDFVQILPYPHCSVEHENASVSYSSETVIIDDREAYAVDSNGDKSKHFYFEGDPVDLVPNHYNYLSMLHGLEDAAMTIGASSTVEIVVTPRYRLPGGLS